MPNSMNSFAGITSIDLRSKVRESGWIHLRGGTSADNVTHHALSLARLLGDLLPGRGGQVVEALKPAFATDANANSLSSRYGIGSFPLHIDGAANFTPPQFIVLACEQPGSAPVPTILARFKDLARCIAECEHLESAPFLVRNGRRSFYSTIVERSRPFVRFDPGCMMPTCARGREILHDIMVEGGSDSKAEIDWLAGDMLILDNWNVLHGRGRRSCAASHDRTLVRVSVR